MFCSRQQSFDLREQKKWDNWAGHKALRVVPVRSLTSLKPDPALTRINYSGVVPATKFLLSMCPVLPARPANENRAVVNPENYPCGWM